MGTERWNRVLDHLNGLGLEVPDDLTERVRALIAPAALESVSTTLVQPAAVVAAFRSTLDRGIGDQFAYVAALL